MKSPIVRIDTREIIDRASFHDVFAKAFGFPGFYGRNMDAFIDCLSYLDDPKAEMTAVHAPAGGVVVLQLDHAKSLAERLPELYADVIECASFVNWRRTESGEEPLIALSVQR